MCGATCKHMHKHHIINCTVHRGHLCVSVAAPRQTEKARELQCGHEAAKQQSCYSNVCVSCIYGYGALLKLFPQRAGDPLMYSGCSFCICFLTCSLKSVIITSPVDSFRYTSVLPNQWVLGDLSQRNTPSQPSHFLCAALL